MNKQFHLKPLVDLAHQKNRDATRRLGELTQQQQSATQKLDTLLQYRTDYQKRFEELSRSGLDRTELQNFQAFIYRLDEAIQQQRDALQQASQSVQAGRMAWMDSQRRMESFDKLEQRHQVKVQQADARTEQKQHDELTGRFAAYGRHNGHNK